MKKIVCEDKYGNEILSFEFKEDITFQKYNNCEISDVELDGKTTVVRLQAIN